MNCNNNNLIINNNIYIGIDFSINSPGICINLNGTYKFISFYNNPKLNEDISLKKKTKRIHKESLHEILTNQNIIELIPYKRFLCKDSYSENQIIKLEDSIFIANLINQKIYEEVFQYSINSKIKYENLNLHIGIEGFSYSSNGQAFIDLISYATILRFKLYMQFLFVKTNSLNIYAPSEIKKFIGKGNYNKFDIFNVFLKETDENLLNTKLFKFISENKNLCLKKEIVNKPIDDLLDSFYIMRLVINNLNKDEKDLSIEKIKINKNKKIIKNK